LASLNQPQPDKHPSNGEISDGIEVDHVRPCCVYDLYAVVHHQGAMGEGHYVTTVRKFSKSQRDRPYGGAATPSLKSVPVSPAASDVDDEEWTCFNDGFISTVKREEIAASPSAYVLFYMRKDIQGKSIDAIFPREDVPVRTDINGLAAKELVGGGTENTDASYRTPTKAPRGGTNQTTPRLSSVKVDDDDEETRTQYTNNSDGCILQ
jgi:hypothetical protein